MSGKVHHIKLSYSFEKIYIKHFSVIVLLIQNKKNRILHFIDV